MAGDPQADESLIETDVRMMFRQGQYAEAVPFIQAHLQGCPDDIPAYELMATALKYSGDKAGAAGALVTAGEMYGQAGRTIQALAAQKKAADLGVQPDFRAARPGGAPAAQEFSFEAEAGPELGFDIGQDLGLAAAAEGPSPVEEGLPDSPGPEMEIGGFAAEPAPPEPSGTFEMEPPSGPEPSGTFEIEPPSGPEPSGTFEIEPPSGPEPSGTFEIEPPSEPAAAMPPPAPRVPSPLFDSLSDEEFLEVAAGLAAREYDEGQDIVVEGEPGESMFIIARGRVSVLVEKGEGQAEVAELGPGDFFGEAALLTGQPRTATCRATKPTDCLELTRTALDSIVAKFPNVQQVMERFNDERADSTIDSLIDFLGD